jgi:hypothetical protein
VTDHAAVILEQVDFPRDSSLQTFSLLSSRMTTRKIGVAKDLGGVAMTFINAIVQRQGIIRKTSVDNARLLIKKDLSGYEKIK